MASNFKDRQRSINTVALSRNQCCHENATMSFLCIVELHMVLSSVFKSLLWKRNNDMSSLNYSATCRSTAQIFTALPRKSNNAFLVLLLSYKTFKQYKLLSSVT
jgi:hypothetical protein